MEPFTAPVWSERRGLFLPGRPRPRGHGSATSASIAGLSGDPMSRLPGRGVVSAGCELARPLQSVGLSVFCTRTKCLSKNP